MLTLYVDASSDKEWNRPKQQATQEMAQNCLQDVGNDYAVQYLQRYTELAFLKNEDPELYQALIGWHDRPKLSPAPRLF
jgi:hypothetical protein